MIIRETSMQYTSEEIARFKRFHAVTPNGVVYEEELSGPDGMHFTLIRQEKTTDQDIKDAIDYLCRQRDITGIAVTTKI